MVMRFYEIENGEQHAQQYGINRHSLLLVSGIDGTFDGQAFADAATGGQLYLGFVNRIVNNAGVSAMTFGMKSDMVGQESREASRMAGGRYTLELCDAFEWMADRVPNSIQAIVTDPPYGLKEYTDIEKRKLRSGRGGVWRIPPTLDGCKRSPLPRFTILDKSERVALRGFFVKFAECAMRVLVPGGHIFIATNPLLSHLVYLPLIDAGFEKRGEVIRLIQTLRGGDRPKNAHVEFDQVTVMPRSGREPWGLFRKPCEGRVQDNLRKWKTGGLRRISADRPFSDVIQSSPARPRERALAPHPSLKPQSFMRQIVRAALPMDEGIILDPFAGAGSTIAAAVAVGYESIGLEVDPRYFEIAERGIPQLARLRESRSIDGNHLRKAVNLSLFVR